MKQLIIPWLATFLFGCAVFVVGKILQRQEKEARKRRAEALKARGWNPGMSLYFEERPTARLKTDFRDPEYRHVYAEESLNTHIATQIKVLREQRNWTQAELAQRCDMQQSRISALEDIDYSSWSIATLCRLSQAFDVRLSVKFETFGSLLPEIENFKKETLERPSFEDDPAFCEAQPLSTNISPALQYTIQETTKFKGRCP